MAVLELQEKKKLTKEEVDLIDAALKKEAELSKEASQKTEKVYEQDEANLTLHQQRMKKINDDAKTAERERKESAERVALANITDALKRESKAVEDDFNERIAKAGKHTQLVLQLQNEKDQKLKALKAQIDHRDAKEQNDLFNLRQERELKAAEDNFDVVHDLKTEQIEANRAYELQQLNLTETQKKIINEKFDQQQRDVEEKYFDAKEVLDSKQQNKQFDKILKADQAAIDLIKENNKAKLDADLKYLKDKHAADIFNAHKDADAKEKIDADYKKAVEDRQKQYDDSIKKSVQGEINLLNIKLQSYQSHFSKLSTAFSKNTEVGKAAFMAQKAFAAANIAIETEQQVASSISATKKLVDDDAGLPFPLNVARVAEDIALGAIDVASTIANGIKQVATVNSVNPQGFARGGLYLSDGYGGFITGPGSKTSDSINAKLSNGEAIINARSTEMFAPILSAINQVGGGRAFNAGNSGNGYAMGGLFNGSNTLNDGYNELANTRAMNDMVKTKAANMPRQVLVVEDVQASLQNKVMLQNMSNF